MEGRLRQPLSPIPATPTIIPPPDDYDHDNENSTGNMMEVSDGSQLPTPAEVPTSSPSPSKHHSHHSGSILRSSSTSPESPSRSKTWFGRRASKSVSNASRPTISITPAANGNGRTKSYHHDHPSLGESSSSTIPSLLASPTRSESGRNVRLGFKKRISTPKITKLSLMGDDDEEDMNVSQTIAVEDGGRGKDAKGKGKGKDQENGTETRARSTSTSVVLPPQAHFEPPSTSSYKKPQQSTPGRFLPTPSPASSFQTPFAPSPIQLDENDSRSTSLLTQVYNLGESSVLRLAKLVKPQRYRSVRRRGSEDSEKGLGDSTESDDFDTTTEFTSSGGSTIRTSEDSYRRTGTGTGTGKYWLSDNLHTPGQDSLRNTEPNGEGGGYFSLPPTPPNETQQLYSWESGEDGMIPSLPTPALSASLSNLRGSGSGSGSGHRNKGRNVMQRLNGTGGVGTNGWWSLIYRIWAGSNVSRSGRTKQVIKELGWTVVLLGGVFFGTALVALWLIQSMPITQLKHLPSSTTDLQLLSAEIRSYMYSGDIGWWHTVGVMTFVGCWKHAWSVPGAVVLNILVGSVLDPISALLLLTIITATGSLFSYLLSRPLAPLIAVLFPKPLSLVKAALAPNSIPSPDFTQNNTDTRITPIQTSSDPTSTPLGSKSQTSVWRRLLIMRAMGFVPWSGMNVACGVVGVDWRVFWLTTAAGSASWSYVTASVGDILSRLAIPQTSETFTDLSSTTATSGASVAGGGESLTSLLRDPTLIAKLIFLSALTLLPVVVKRKNPTQTQTDSSSSFEHELRQIDTGTPSKNTRGRHHAFEGVDSDGDGVSTPSSPITKSLQQFTPTPAAFDLLSFGRTAMRQSVKLVMVGGRKVASSIKGPQ